jgi:hypothetical protein
MFADASSFDGASDWRGASGSTNRVPADPDFDPDFDFDFDEHDSLV